MDTLRIFLLGPLEVCRGERCLGRFAVRGQQLLGYLLIHRDTLLSREVLAELFWGDTTQEHARGNLRTSLWRLRAVLEPDDCPRGRHLVVERDRVGFNSRSDYWLDLQAFEEASRSGPSAMLPEPQTPAATISRLTRAVSLYRGDLLDGCYEDWCIFERERLKELLLRNLSHLMVLHRDLGAYGDALQCGQRLLSYDPLLEEVHRELMRLHCLAGNRGAAIRQYQGCRELLARELDIAPMAETTALHDRIVAGQEPAAILDDLRPIYRAGTTALDETLAELRLVQREFDHLRGRLRQGVAQVEALRQEWGHGDRS